MLIGAAFILLAFALIQTGRMRPGRLLPTVLNFIGALMLATNALSSEQSGFFILNVAWTLIAAWALVRRGLLSAEANEHTRT